MTSKEQQKAKVKNSQPKAFRPQERDYQLVKAVYEYRALTTPQIEELIFSTTTKNERSRKATANRRLKLLYDHGYLWRGEQASKPSEGKKPYLYRIEKKALEWLSPMLDEEPRYNPKERGISILGLNHLIKSNDVRIALSLAAAANGLEIRKWVDEKTLRTDHANEKIIIKSPQGAEKKVTIIPDGYFILAQNINGYHGAHFFIEVDLATETVQASQWGAKDWKRKIQTYNAFHQSGKYKKRYRTNYMTVLTVTTSEERSKNLKQATEELKGKPKYFFTTFDQMSAQTILTDPIWQVAGRQSSVAIKDLIKITA